MLNFIYFLRLVNNTEQFSWEIAVLFNGLVNKMILHLCCFKLRCIISVSKFVVFLVLFEIFWMTIMIFYKKCRNNIVPTRKTTIKYSIFLLLVCWLQKCCIGFWTHLPVLMLLLKRPTLKKYKALHSQNVTITVLLDNKKKIKWRCCCILYGNHFSP